MRLLLLFIIAAVTLQTSTPSARAQAPGNLAAAMGLTAADGSVRTQAGVRVSLSPAAGGGDYVVKMRTPVQAQMGAIRRCFAEGMMRDASVQGRAMFAMEALSRGRARATVTLNGTGQPAMVECMRRALVAANLTGIPKGARVLVGLDLSNPTAALHAQMRRRSERVSVSPLHGGRAESTGSTQQGEVRFALRGSAFATKAIADLHHDVETRLAGLLDCRRKASRRNRAAEGTITLELTVAEGKVERVRTAANGVNDRSAPACVIKWLERADKSHLHAANVTLDVTFAR